MPRPRHVAILIFSVLLSACQSLEPRPETFGSTRANQLVWHDADFSFDPNLITHHLDDLFYLDPDMRNQIQLAASPDSSRQNRIRQMLELIFGADNKSFFYFSSHSTVATETWKNRQGDCVSLTIFAYALAKELDLPATMQQVKSIATFDRRDQIDFINEHVNLVIKNNRSLRTKTRIYPAQNIVIDFDPAPAVAGMGLAVSEAGMTARFYNNLAAQYLAHGNQQLAYAYFKAAILIAPDYANSYSNLAQLYLTKNLQADAEVMLRHALVIAPDSYITLRSLKNLMHDQNRQKEENQFAEKLTRLQENDPYYWISLGVQQLNDQHNEAAIVSLERAASMAKGFAEIHANLALAYRRTNQTEKEQSELAILRSIDPERGLTNQVDNHPP